MMIKYLVVFLGVFGFSIPVLAEDVIASSAGNNTRSAQVTTLAQFSKTQFGIDIKTMSFSSRQACEDALAHLPAREPHESAPRCF